MTTHTRRISVALAATVVLAPLAATATTANAATTTTTDAGTCVIAEQPGDASFVRDVFTGYIYPDIAGPFTVEVDAADLAHGREVVNDEDFIHAEHRAEILTLLDACESGENIALAVPATPAGSATALSSTLSSEPVGVFTLVFDQVKGWLQFFLGN